MNKVIWKEQLADFKVSEAGHMVCEARLPVGAEILNVDEQHGQICVWFSAPIGDSARDTFCFAAVPTGGEIPAAVGLKSRHLGTVLLDQGAFVWHIFLL